MQTFRIIVNQTTQSYNVVVKNIIRSYVIQANSIRWKSLGERGPAGRDGKSAFELSQDAGFTGSLDDFTKAQKGKDGYTPIKEVDYFDGSRGVDGYTPIKGKDYFDGHTPVKNVDYFDGRDGNTPYIQDGNWWISQLDTGISANGIAGISPNIGTNGNWFIGTTDTGVYAQGPAGDPTLLLDDTQVSLTKTYSSSYINSNYERIIGLGNSNQYFNGLKQWVNFPTIPTQYTDTMARAAQYTANGTTTGLLTYTDFLAFNAKVTFPGFGTSHVTAAYGDHTHSIYYLASNPNGYTTNMGTVTNIAGFSVNTTGTDVSSSVTNSTVSPLLTISIPTASATNRGALSSLDWIAFNSKQSSIGFTPEQQLTFSTGLSRVGNTITNSFTAFKTVNSVSVVGNGDIYIPSFPGFGTGNGAAWGYSAHPTTISGYGITDAILNQNSSAQSANMWINGVIKTTITDSDTPTTGAIIMGGSYVSQRIGTDKSYNVDVYNNGNLTNAFKLNQSGAATFSSTVSATQLQSTIATGTAPLTVNSTTMVGNLNAELFGGSLKSGFIRNIGYLGNNVDLNTLPIGINANPGNTANNVPTSAYGVAFTISTDPYYGWQMYQDYNGQLHSRSAGNGIWNTWRTIYDSGNLTNNLSTNYIPKWNGSSMVNSLINDNGSNLSINANVTNAYHLLNRNSITTEHGFSWSTSNTVKWFFGQRSFNSEDGLSLYSVALTGDAMYFKPNGEITLGSTTASTSPTNGALVVSGGIGVGGQLNTSSDIQAGGFGTDRSVLSRYFLGYGGNSWISLNGFGGNVMVGYSSDQGYKLAVNGTGYFNGAVTSSSTFTATNFIGSSDARLKNIFNSIVPQKLNIDYKEYEFKNQLGIRRFGVIAQDLLSNGYGKFVDKSSKMYGVNYIDLLISEIVYLKYKVEELERRIT